MGNVNQERETYSKYEEEIARKSKLTAKQFFQNVRSKKNAKVSIGPLTDDNISVNVNDNKRMASVLIKAFKIVFTIEAEEPLSEPVNVFLGPKNDKLLIHDTMEDEILKY